ncbi:hypothetical protein KJ068_28965 [bacterium]|nr:hypothetical protein [bacterium]
MLVNSPEVILLVICVAVWPLVAQDNGAGVPQDRRDDQRNECLKRNVERANLV